MSKRRTARLRVCCLAAASLLVFLQRAGAADAVGYQNDPAHDGATFMSSFTPTPSLLWSANLGAAASYAVIAQGEVYVSAGTEGQTPVTELEALNQATGHLDWSQTLVGQSVFSSPSSAPAYDNGKIFLLNQEGYNSTMNAYDATTGNLLWSTVPGMFQYDFASPPVATNGIVYFTGNGDGSTVYAMQESNGSLLWASNAGSGATPAVSNGILYVTSAGNVSALSATTGKSLWGYSSGMQGGGSATPIVSGGQVYIRDILPEYNNNDNAIVFNATTGTELYKFIPGLYGGIPPTPALYDGTGYVEYSGQLDAFDPTDGAFEWTDTLTSDQFATAPIVVDGVVYDGTANGELYAIDGGSGTVISETNVGTSFTNNGEGWPFAPLPGLTAGDGLLVASAGDTVNVYALPEPSFLAIAMISTGWLLKRRDHRHR
jgi:outer membrane protein assembly factor BamB